MFGWIFETFNVDMAIRLVARYLWLRPGMLVYRLRLRRDLVGDLHCFRLLDHYGDQLVPVRFLKKYGDRGSLRRLPISVLRINILGGLFVS